MDFKINDGMISQDARIKGTVFRADGKVEIYWSSNLFLIEGMTYLAALQSTAPDSVMNHMIVGSCTNAVSLNASVQSCGEMKRNTMASRTNASNVLTEVCTFAGGLDNITSKNIGWLVVTNDARSGNFGKARSATLFNPQICLASSDFVNFQYATTCGSQ
jgi:hypothetical protein